MTTTKRWRRFTTVTVCAVVIFMADQTTTLAQQRGTTPAPNAQTAPVAPPRPAASAARQDPAEVQRRINATGRRGFLFEAIRGTRTVFLYGSVNANKEEYFPLNPPVMLALAQSTRLLTEKDPSNPQDDSRSALALGAFGQGDSLERYLSPDAMKRLNEVADGLGLSTLRLYQFKPWLAAAVIEQEYVVRRGYQPGQNPVLFFVGYARSRNLRIGELEGATAQFKLLDGLPMATQADELVQALNGIVNARALKKLDLLIDNGWATGNVASVVQAIAVDQSTPGPWTDFYAKNWLAARSQRLAAAIDADSANDGTPFVAIEAVNLLGNTGVAAELAKRGFAIRDLQTP